MRIVTVTLTIALLTVLSGAPAFADDTQQQGNLDRQQAFSIQAQALDAALLDFSDQANVQVMVAAATLEGLETNGVEGNYTPRSALAVLLDSNDLQFTEVGSTVAVTSTAEQGGDSDSKNLNVGPTAVLMARSMAAQTTSTNPRQEENQKKNSEQEEELEEIIVVGSHLKGVAPAGTPITIYDRVAIEASGHTALFDFLRSVPQIFTSELSDRGYQSVDIRGLGEDATLVLVNGRRMATGSQSGVGSVDISTIPTSMVERIEVLTDGASAVYGSDAVAGVVNIVLRNDVRGAETGFTYSVPSQGGAERLQFTQSLGTTWSSGSLIGSYAYETAEKLLLSDRPAFGGVDSIGFVPGGVAEPGIDKHGLMLVYRQSLGQRTELFVESLYDDRDVDALNALDPRNIGTLTDATQLRLTAGVSVDFSHDWLLDLEASWSSSDQSGIFQPNRGVEVEATLQSALARVAGPLFSVPGGRARLAVGGERRAEDFTLDFLVGASSFANSTNEQEITGGFLELFLPWVSESNARAGLQSLSMSLSARHDSYEDFGSEVVPRVGITWEPAAGLTIRGSWSESYRAPNLFEQQQSGVTNPVLVGLDPDPLGSNPLIPGRSIVLTVLGSTELTPERSENLTLGVDWTPVALPGFTVSLTYFDIDFTDRIDAPRPTLGDAQDEAAFADFISRAATDPAGQAAFQAAVDAWLALPAPTQVLDFRSVFGLDGEPVTVIFDSRVTNLALTRSKGLDLDLNYAMDTAHGDLELALVGTYTLEQGVSPVAGAPFSDDVDRINRPAALKLRGRLGWNSGRWNTDLYLNYVDSYLDGRLGFETTTISSWTTADFNLRYRFGGDGLLQGTQLGLSAINVFDRDPPQIGAQSSGTRFYDFTNHNALGRRLTLSLTKTW